MNLVLFDPAELEHPLPLKDPRARHVREILRRHAGDPFDCGLIDGPRGRARVEGETQDGLELSFVWGEPPPPLDPVWLLVGLSRPQTVRKILGEATTLGVARMLFFLSDRSEASYAASSLWKGDAVRRHLIAGAEQASCTRLPEVSLLGGLEEALEAVRAAVTRVALDNYEAPSSLSQMPAGGPPAVLAVGAERGWTKAERAQLRAAGFVLSHLGPRVLRTETACVAGLTLLKARLGLM
jgi:16S rRNA (uracil1498-N3)-methyltransferase